MSYPFFEAKLSYRIRCCVLSSQLGSAREGVYFFYHIILRNVKIMAIIEERSLQYSLHGMATSLLPLYHIFTFTFT